MLRAERMSRVLIVGPKPLLEGSVEILHRVQSVHLVDYAGADEGFELGRPLARSAETSESLLKLRAIAATLKIEREEGGVLPDAPPDVRDRILALEQRITEEEENRKRIEGLVQDLGTKIQERTPFPALGLPYEAYHGYASLAVLVGPMPKDAAGLEGQAPRIELFTGGGYLAAFVPKAQESAVRDALGRQGFSSVEVPETEGDPREVLARYQADLEKWRTRLTEAEGRLQTMREKFADFLLKAEAGLELAVEKAEAPLRFATSEHTFVVEGWVPTARVDPLRAELQRTGNVHVETEPAHAPAHEDEAEPPVLLRNRGVPKRFQFLVSLFSTPSYHELDPTLFLSIGFPIFFGLMIGDAGYGALWAVLGGLGYAKMKPGQFRDLMFAMMLGGLMATIFGLFVWGEAFGIPFHLKIPSDIVALGGTNPGLAASKYAEWTREAAHELSWACGDLAGVANPCLGVDVPVVPMMNKLQKLDIVAMLLVSITLALLHLTAAFVLGIVNEWRHSKKHVAAKVAWILALWGLFAIIFSVVKAGCDGWIIGEATHCQYTYFVSGTLLPWADLGNLVTIPVVGISMPLSSLVLLLIAALIVAATESPVAPMEIASVLANMISYARLAGIGVAKAATIGAFNLMLVPMVLGDDLVWKIVGAVLLVLAQMLVFFLGAISAGIQAIRLNWVEFFIKFFKGNGTVFRPFGEKTATEA